MHLRLCALAVLAAVASAPPLFAAEPASIKVTLGGAGQGMKIALSQGKVKAGPVEFEVKNASQNVMHEFLIAPWKGSITSLPYDTKASQAAEDKLTGLQGIEDMKPGQEATVRLVLRPGDYVVFCNQPGHYKMGMEQRFVVTR